MSLDLIEVADAIEDKINLLDRSLPELIARAKRKADTIGAYEKRLAIVMMQLRNGVEFTLDGKTVKDPPATLTEKIARGICFQEKIDMELSESAYKNAIKGLDVTTAQLNGYQSINRHLKDLSK